MGTAASLAARARVGARPGPAGDLVPLRLPGRPRPRPRRAGRPAGRARDVALPGAPLARRRLLPVAADVVGDDRAPLARADRGALPLLRRRHPLRALRGVAPVLPRLPLRAPAPHGHGRAHADRGLLARRQPAVLGERARRLHPRARRRQHHHVATQRGCSRRGAAGERRVPLHLRRRADGHGPHHARRTHPARQRDVPRRHRARARGPRRHTALRRLDAPAPRDRRGDVHPPRRLHRLGALARVGRARRGRPAQRARHAHARHLGAQGGRVPARPPGPPRPADRPAEPHAVQREAREGARRGRRGRALRRPRRVQDRQRLPRALRGRRAARSSSPSGYGMRCAPATPSPASAGTSSRSCSRASTTRASPPTSPTASPPRSPPRSRSRDRSATSPRASGCAARSPAS